jgi:hypothetical protein
MCSTGDLIVFGQALDTDCLGPYHVENTSSRLITEVKQH